MSRYEIARQWERWFLDGTELSYSLNLSIDDPGVDPILDFLQNTRRGHCEYFASALALLLRTQGIPTRVVSCYKGGQVDEGGAVIVRDLHAHLWVEAFVDDAPDDVLTGQVGARWVTFDPTPAARDVAVQSQELASASAWGRLRDSWLMLWSSSIRMNETDQRALVYEPIRDAFQSLWADVRGTTDGRSGRSWRQLLLSPREWFSWRGGLFVFVVLVCASASVAGARRLLGWRRQRLPAGGSSGATRVVIGFYDRLEHLLKRHGLVRLASQTPREFAVETQSDIEQRTPPQYHGVPSSITDLFYSLRFGQHSLNSAELASVELQLDHLERELDTDALRREH
jgi:hypothetical protein